MKLLLGVIALVSFVNSAPLTQYLIYQPTPSTSLYNLPGQIVQSTTPIRLQDGKQVLYYYPSSAISPFGPYQILSVKDDTGSPAAPGGEWDVWTAFQNWWESVQPGQGGGAAAPVESPAAETMKLADRLDMEKLQEMKKDNKKFYIINGQPQFFGNYAALNAPLSPLYSLPVATILGRSKDTQVAAESVQVPVQVPFEPAVKASLVIPEQIQEVVQPEQVVLAEPQIVQQPIQVVQVAPQGRSSSEGMELTESPMMAEMMMMDANMEKKKEEEMKEEMMEIMRPEEKKPEGNFFLAIFSTKPSDKKPLKYDLIEKP